MRGAAALALLFATSCARTCDRRADEWAELESVAEQRSAASFPAPEANVRAALQKAGIDLKTFVVGRRFEAGPAFVLTFRGNDAVQAWRKARSVLPRLGYWPVLFEIEGTPQTLCEADASREPLAKILERSRGLSAAKWLAERTKDDPEYFQVERGSWPAEPQPMTAFTLPFDVLSHQPRDIWLALVPTPRPWEVPALCGYGGFNECPDPDEHVALQKYWNETHGAELVGMSRDVIEMVALRPPTTEDAARRLAHEQFLYAPDIVFQGTNELEPLAAGLLNARLWYFWWD